MPKDTMALAFAPPADTASEQDYEALVAALSESARGRAFLAEYARRNRGADTEVLLAALSRLESHFARDGSAVDRLRDELRMLLIAIRIARPEIEAAAAPVKAEKLAALLDMLDRRIEAIAGPHAGELPPVEETPPPEEPEAEAPLPSPATVAPPAAQRAPADPLAALNALSDDERLALFT